MNLRQLSTPVKKLSSTNRHVIAITALLLIAIASHWRWFYEPYTILTYGDWWYYNQEQMSEFFSWPKILTNDNFGGINIGISTYHILLAYGILNKFLPYSLIERIIFFWPSIIVCALGSYYMGWKLTRNHVAAFIQSIVYTYNVYFLLIRTGHLTMAVSYAIAPFIFGLLISLLKSPKIKYSLWLSLAYFIAGTYEIRALYLTTLVVIVLTLTAFVKSYKSPKYIAMCTALLLLSACIVFLFNFYWISALTSANYIGANNSLFQRTLFGSQYMSMYRSLTLFHPFWSAGPPVPFIIQMTPVYFFLIPIFALVPFSKNRSLRYYFVVFGLISLLGIFLTKMSHPPFKDLYEWLYLNFPGFGAFRESSKFYFYIALGYSTMIAINFASFSAFIDAYRIGFLVKRVVFIIIIFLFLLNTKPFIDGSIGTILAPQQMPKEFAELNSLLSHNEGMHRIVVIPYHSRWVSITQSRPYVDYNDLLEFANQHVSDVNLKAPTIVESVESNLHKPQLLRFMAEWSIRYIIVPLSHESVGESPFTAKPGLMTSLKQNGHFRHTIITDSRGEELGLFELIDPSPRQTLRLDDAEAIYEKNRVILSTKFSKNWILSHDNIRTAGVEDSFGRVLFENIKDQKDISLTFAPQEKINANFRWSVGALVFVLSALMMIHIRELVQHIYRRIMGKNDA
ncbi:MAG: hypothetical protein WCJ70_00620 [bacterium]